MVWMIKRLFWIGVLVAVVYYGANYKIERKPIKQYVSEFYHAPLIQAAIKTGKEVVVEFLEEKVGDKKEEKKEEGAVVQDQISEQDRQQLESILKKEAL